MAGKVLQDQLYFIACIPIDLILTFDMQHPVTVYGLIQNPLFLFTVPVTAPTIVTAVRTDATSALMKWEPLSLEQLRGNLTSYVIVYTPLENECPSHSNTNKEEIMSIQPIWAITDMLDPGQEYCVGVAVKTGAGTGMFSYEIIPRKYSMQAQPYMHKHDLNV